MSPRQWAFAHPLKKHSWVKMSRCAGMQGHSPFPQGCSHAGAWHWSERVLQADGEQQIKPHVKSPKLEREGDRDPIWCSCLCFLLACHSVFPDRPQFPHLKTEGKSQVWLRNSEDAQTSHHRLLASLTVYESRILLSVGCYDCRFGHVTPKLTPFPLSCLPTR
jgi:hypothetical protein